MSNHSQSVELLGAYALDALDEAEAGMVRAHLVGCAECRADLAEHMRVAASLAGLSPSRQPSAGLRGRVLAAVERTRVVPPVPQSYPARPREPRLRWAVAALVVVLLISQVWLLANLNSLRAQLVRQQEIQTILLSSGEQPVELQPLDPASDAHGTYWSEPDIHRGLLNYYYLPLPERGQSYQCWLEFAAGPAAPCGRLPLDREDHGILLITLPDSATPIGVRVTLETGRVSVPTGPTVMAAQLKPGGE